MNSDRILRPAVVVPLYRKLCSADEDLSLRLALQVLSAHPVIGAVPAHLADFAYWRSQGLQELEVFDDADFSSVARYNQLMLDARFYRRFAAYSHILIYQTDALVLSDQLDEWCRQPYDYIGAPWAFPWAYWPAWRSVYKRVRADLYRRLDLRGSHGARLKWCALCVGNGGFSLRRVDAFLQALGANPPALASYRRNGLPAYPEDFFWGIDVNRDALRIRVPGWREALAFAVESAPPQAVREIGGLPFGVHAWDRGFRKFWLEQLASAQPSFRQ